MNTTALKPSPGMKFLATSADDHVGVGVILVGHGLAKDAEGNIHLNTGDDSDPDWVIVHDAAEVPEGLQVDYVDWDTVPEDPTL